MISPRNEAYWYKNEYHKIVHQSMFSGVDAFCDEKGEINKEIPRTLWTNTFNDHGETKVVNIVAKYYSIADIEKIIQLGFKEGFTMALENLDQSIEAQFKLRKQNKTSNNPRVSS